MPLFGRPIVRLRIMPMTRGLGYELSSSVPFGPGWGVFEIDQQTMETIVTEAILYTATATATGGREGRAASDDGRLDVVLSVPKALGGNDGPGTNPEQLFGGGYAACFLGAVKLVARLNKVKLSDDVSVTAQVGVGPDAIGYRLTIALRVSIPGVDRAVAEQLLAGAHERCPFSKATRGNIDVDVQLAEQAS
jgi:Ohr subfamily peroxiredoxin